MKKLHKILGLLLAAATVVSLSGCHSLTDEQKEQLEKIEHTFTHNTKKITETSEKAMENMIKLLEIRYSRKG